MKKKEGELVVVSLDVLAFLKDFSGKHGSCGKSALKLQRFEVKYHHRANLSFHKTHGTFIRWEMDRVTAYTT